MAAVSNFFDHAVELPMHDFPLLDLDGVPVAKLHDATVPELAEAIREQRAEGWKFLRTDRDRLRDVVVLSFKR